MASLNSAQPGSQEGTHAAQPPEPPEPQQDTSPHEFGRVHPDLYPIGPHYAEYGRSVTFPGPWVEGETEPRPPSIIPVAKLGWAHLPPAEWAAYFKDEASSVSTPTLNRSAIGVLRAAPSLQEPLLRHEKPISNIRLSRKVSLNFQNLESALIQTVGIIEPQECTYCLRGNGRWEKCISSHDPEDTITSCGNCQWNSSGERCNLPHNRPA
ncbi:unnamed protein product [Penicillium pancosmium]